MDEQSSPGAPSAGLLRRLAALVYDSLLLLAILFVGTAPVLALTGGEAITPAAKGPGAYLLYRAWLALLTFGYFGLAWTRGGQTLGLMAWKSRLETEDGRTPGWPVATRRFALGLVFALAAEFGLRCLFEPGASAGTIAGGILLLLPPCANFAWIPFDARGRSLQDRVSGTRVRRVAMSVHAPDRDRRDGGQ